MRSDSTRVTRHVVCVMLSGIAWLPVVSQDWPMWGGTPQRNMTSSMKGLPASWDVKSGTNIKWKAPVPANGVLYVMTRSDLYAIVGSTAGSAR